MYQSQSTFVERRTHNSRGIKRKLVSHVKNAAINIEGELSLEEILSKELDLLKEKITDLELQKDLKDNEINNLQNLLTQSKFSVDKFKHNTAHFKFYTYLSQHTLNFTLICHSTL